MSRARALVKKRSRDASAEKSWSAELSRRAPLDKALTLELFRAREEASEPQRAEIDALIIQGNLRLIMSIARKYDKTGQKLLDFCQEGCIGAMRAIEKFDHKRGNSFPTYATWWIRQAIAQFARGTSRDVRLPAHAVAALKELASGAENPKSSAVVIDAVKHAKREVSLSSPAYASNSAGSRDGRPATVADVLPSDAESPEDVASHAELRRAVIRGIMSLSVPELIALRMRFGLLEDAPDDAV